MIKVFKFLQSILWNCAVNSISCIPTMTSVLSGRLANFSYLAIIVFFLNNHANAQSIPWTGDSDSYCSDCLPPGYSLVSGEANIAGRGGFGFNDLWLQSLNEIETPVTGAEYFIAFLQSSQTKSKLSTTITGLVPGNYYRLQFAVCGLQTATHNLTPKKAIAQIVSGGTGSVEVDELHSSWKYTFLVFEAIETTAVINFFGEGEGQGGYIGLDAGMIEIAVQPEQVQLSTNSITLPCTKDYAKNGVDFTVLSKGFERFYDNPFHTGEYKGEYLAPGIYYAFTAVKSSTDPSIEIFNTNYSTSVLTITQSKPNAAEQVQLSKSSINACTGATVNLNTALSTPIPAGLVLKWYTTADHSTPEILNPNNVSADTYYAFYFDPATGCYNTDYSTAKVKVTFNAQVELSKNSLGNLCPANSVSLGLSFQGEIPENTGLVWYTTPNHTDETLVADAGSVTNGVYYAFFYDFLNNCFNTDASTAQVNVTIGDCNACKAGTNQVSLNKNSLDNACPQINVNLNSTLDEAVPPGATLIWYSNNNHSGAPLKTPTSVGQAGDYYAFYYDSNQDCFNTNQSTAHLTVTISSCETACHGGLPQVELNGGKLGIVCPAATADLNSKFSSAPPQGYSLVWFQTNIPLGNPIAHPNAVGSGSYYAFFYDSKNKCYNVEQSTALVTVAGQGPCVSKLSIGVFLSGAVKAGGGAVMRNDLQLGSLLPVSDPYGNGSSSSNINNVGSAGQVVDWVLVEIRSADAPYQVIEAKSLLLKTNGAVVGTDGLVPSFGQQKNAFRLAVKHRNHQAILSNVLPINAEGLYTYDFTGFQTSAFIPDGYPKPLCLSNGTWSMWSGDIDQDGGVDTADHNAAVVGKNAGLSAGYHAADVNLDGKVDQTDVDHVYTSNGEAVFSTLSQD